MSVVSSVRAPAGRQVDGAEVSPPGVCILTMDVVPFRVWTADFEDCGVREVLHVRDEAELVAALAARPEVGIVVVDGILRLDADAAQLVGRLGTSGLLTGRVTALLVDHPDEVERVRGEGVVDRVFFRVRSSPDLAAETTSLYVSRHGLPTPDADES